MVTVWLPVCTEGMDVMVVTIVVGTALGIGAGLMATLTPLAASSGDVCQTSFTELSQSAEYCKYMIILHHTSPVCQFHAVIWLIFQVV